MLKSHICADGIKDRVIFLFFYIVANYNIIVNRKMKFFEAKDIACRDWRATVRAKVDARKA